MEAPESILVEGDVQNSWTEAEGIFTPKKQNSKTVNQLRTISVLNVEEKIFFAILAKRLTRNAYIDTSVQEGGVPQASQAAQNTPVPSHN